MSLLAISRKFCHVNQDEKLRIHIPVSILERQQRGGKKKEKKIEFQRRKKTTTITAAAAAAHSNECVSSEFTLTI